MTSILNRLNVKFLLMVLFAGDVIAQTGTGNLLLDKQGRSGPPEYTVTNVTSINTAKAEFAPFVFNKGLLFITERNMFDFERYSFTDKNEVPAHNIYVSEIEGGDVKKEKLFSKNLSSEFQNGPACITADGKTLFVTRVARQGKKNSVNQTQIFTASITGSKLSQLRPLAFNSQEFSAGHPAVSPDQKTLYFTSNMPGGFGGKDIWMCEKEGDAWGLPVNLGSDINTSGDEFYPSVRKDGTVFFSSNGLPGYGGLDIYSARKTGGKWILNRNEGLNLNSEADDFGITFLNDTLGFFTSNRTGGHGQEDIYFYAYHERSLGMSGIILLTENLRDFARNKKVLLLDENGAAIDSAVTDSNGLFRFRRIDADKKYMVSVTETDPVLAGKARYFLSQNDSVIRRISSRMFGKRFVFRNLPVDSNTFPDISMDDTLVFAGILKYGNDGLPLRKARVRIANEYNDVVMETTTNDFGSFAFRNLPSDQNYLVTIEESETNLPGGTKVTLLNKSGKEVRYFLKTRERLKFSVLQSDRVLLKDMSLEDVELVMSIHGTLYDQNRKPIVNARINIKEGDGMNDRMWVTGAEGKFTFTGLAAHKQYIFEADENEPALKGVNKIYVADNTGKIFKVVYLQGGKFTFKIMETEKFLLGEFVSDDPWLKLSELNRKPTKDQDSAGTRLPAAGKINKPDSSSVSSITIVENIYYASGDFKLDAAARSILNRAVSAMKSNPDLFLEIGAHTDSKASDGFNMLLSKKRAQAAVEYVTQNGIHRARLKAAGFGETRLLNACGNGNDCSEDQHKKNRRTEFKFSVRQAS
jgi:outer membrane protein OmpA-like peptidoglycan-associated protein